MSLPHGSANHSAGSRPNSCSALAAFIRGHVDVIVQRWAMIPYAGHCPSGGAMLAQLGSQAQSLLEGVAHHVEGGEVRPGLPSLNVCAERYALAHLAGGLTEVQLVLTMQALRKQVLQQWSQSLDEGGLEIVEAIAALNQAFDHALAAAVDHYSRARDRCHGLFLKTLAHDLRNPLGGLELTGQLLQQNAMYAVGRMHKISASINRSVGNAVRITGDIYDLGSMRDGLGITINPVELDAAVLCGKVIDDLTSRYPDQEIAFESPGPLMSTLDESRISQAFFNLIAYALHHSDKTEPVSIKLAADKTSLLFSLSYASLAPAAEEVQYLFEPMRRYAAHILSKKGPLTALGIDVFIAREIISAHEGEIRASAQGDSIRIEAQIPLHAA